MEQVDGQLANANDETTMEQSTTPTAGLQNLIDDCKEMVFERLELVDLLNVADSSKQMQPTVCQIFERNHSNRRIVIDIENKNR